MADKAKETHLFPQVAYTKEWQEIWLKLMESSQESLKEYWGIKPKSAEETPVVTIFDPEVVTTALSKAMLHFVRHPERLIELQQNHLQEVRLLVETINKKLKGEQVEPLITLDPKDKRFNNPAWQENSLFFFIQQLYFLNAKLLRLTLKELSGIDEKTEHKLEFYTRQLIDALSPTNFPLTNPDVLQETYETKGENLIQGFRNLLRDSANGTLNIRMTDMSALKLGRDIATAKGKVVLRSELFELIRYEPTTAKVSQIPLLIIPPWINKFYVFDLKPENSFIRWAVDSGLTVYMISWVNPDKRHAKKSLTDYTLDGAHAALEYVRTKHKLPQVNVLGYCTGGVLLNCLLTYLEAKGLSPVKSASVIAAPIDYKEAGDLLVYICEQQLDKLEKHAKKQGYVSGDALMNAFNLLRANDLIWSFYVNNYLMGKEPIPFDMLHWNSDAARMPAKMQLDFLRKMYLENKLIQPGGISIADVPVDLSKIKLPMFTMAAIDDHIAPWRAVYPLITKVQAAQKKFVLSGSGHVAGVFNHPDKNKYFFWSNDEIKNEPDEWLKMATKNAGSWWPVWREWLSQFSGKEVKANPIPADEALDEAPGTYVVSP